MSFYGSVRCAPSQCQNWAQCKLWLWGNWNENWEINSWEKKKKTNANFEYRQQQLNALIIL